MVVRIKRACVVFGLAILGLFAGRIVVAVLTALALPAAFYDRHPLLMSLLEVPLLVAAIAGVVLSMRLVSATARGLNPALTGLLTTAGVVCGNWVERVISPAREDISFLLPFTGLMIAVAVATHWAWSSRPTRREVMD